MPKVTALWGACAGLLAFLGGASAFFFTQDLAAQVAAGLGVFGALFTAFWGLDVFKIALLAQRERARIAFHRAHLFAAMGNLWRPVFDALFAQRAAILQALQAHRDTVVTFDLPSTDARFQFKLKGINRNTVGLNVARVFATQDEADAYTQSANGPQAGVLADSLASIARSVQKHMPFVKQGPVSVDILSLTFHGLLTAQSNLTGLSFKAEWEAQAENLSSEAKAHLAALLLQSLDSLTVESVARPAAPETLLFGTPLAALSPTTSPDMKQALKILARFTHAVTAPGNTAPSAALRAQLAAASAKLTALLPQSPHRVSDVWPLVDYVVPKAIEALDQYDHLAKIANGAQDTTRLADIAANLQKLPGYFEAHTQALTHQALDGLMLDLSALDTVLSQESALLVPR